MKTSKKMQAVITRIAEKHGLDLTEVGAYLRLEMPSYQPLVIHVLPQNRVVVAHYDEPPGMDVQIGDPEIVFFTNYAEWVPMSITQAVGGFRIYAALTPDKENLATIAPKSQADLAEFAEMWARNIERQGWLEEGRKHDPSLPTPSEVVRSSPWPVPTVERPDYDTLEEWLWEDGVCEATDGCPVEPDGVCPHGHPSWFLKLGLI